MPKYSQAEEQGGHAEVGEQVDKRIASNQSLDQWVGFSDEGDKCQTDDSDTEGSDADFVDATNATEAVSACYHSPASYTLIGCKGLTSSFSEEARTNSRNGLPYRLQKKADLTVRVSTSRHVFALIQSLVRRKGANCYSAH